MLLFAFGLDSFPVPLTLSKSLSSASHNEITISRSVNFSTESERKKERGWFLVLPLGLPIHFVKSWSLGNNVYSFGFGLNGH